MTFHSYYSTTFEKRLSQPLIQNYKKEDDQSKYLIDKINEGNPHTPEWAAVNHT